MNPLQNPALMFVAGFLIVLLILFMPLVPAVLAFSDGYGGDGVYLVSPPPNTQYASSGGYVFPDGEYLWPVPGVNKYTSGFGMRFHPIKSKWRMHYGIDIGASEGKNIIAVEDGIVSFAGIKSGYGKVVIIEHNNETSTLYAHCSKLLVKANQYINRGDTIARVGNTGLSTGSHLHFEIRINNTAVDPLPYVASGR